jgi:hypothetical protein
MKGSVASLRDYIRLIFIGYATSKVLFGRPADWNIVVLMSVLHGLILWVGETFFGRK